MYTRSFKDIRGNVSSAANNGIEKLNSRIKIAETTRWSRMCTSHGQICGPGYKYEKRAAQVQLLAGCHELQVGFGRSISDWVILCGIPIFVRETEDTGFVGEVATATYFIFLRSGKNCKTRYFAISVMLTRNVTEDVAALSTRRQS